MATVIIGIGNPVLSDDSVGLKIARRLKDELKAVGDVTVKELCSGGIDLMETMIGYDRAIIIDAIIDHGGKPGTIYPLAIDDTRTTRNSCSTHSGSLALSLDLGRMAGLQLPQDVRFLAVAAGDVTTFSENLTEDVERAVPLAAARVVRDVCDMNGLSSMRRKE